MPVTLLDANINFTRGGGGGGGLKSTLNFTGNFKERFIFAFVCTGD